MNTYPKSAAAQLAKVNRCPAPERERDGQCNRAGATTATYHSAGMVRRRALLDGCNEADPGQARKHHSEAARKAKKRIPIVLCPEKKNA
jgi:hypothetical protein